MARIAAPIPLAFLTAAMIWFGWVGYYGSDDMSYAEGAMGWIDSFPYVGQAHWNLRHTVVIPIAVAFATLGISEFALVLPTVLYLLALLGLVHYVLNRYFDGTVAALAVFVLATMPMLPTQGTVVVPDFAEVFFCLLSATLFFEATDAERPHRLLLAAGVAAGFAWLTRETVAFFLVSYLVLFLFGFGVPRRLYFVMAGGFLAIVACEFLYFAVMIGDPLYRIVVDLKTHLGVDASGGGSVIGGVERSMSRTEVGGYDELTRTGNISVNRYLDPIIAVLANQEFMFFYYLAIPAIVWMIVRRGRLNEVQKRFLIVFGLVAMVWFAFLELQFGMTLLPRYYLLPTVVACMVFAMWLRFVVMPLPHARLLVFLILGFLLATNLIGIYVDNRNPIFAERSLIEFAKQTDEVIRTDPETERRGRFLFEIAGVANRIVAGRPAKGDLFFANPKYVLWGAQSSSGPKAIRNKLADYQPQPGWHEVWRRNSDRKAFGIAIEKLGLKRFVPTGIYRRLDKPNPDVVVFRP